MDIFSVSTTLRSMTYAGFLITATIGVLPWQPVNRPPGTANAAQPEPDEKNHAENGGFENLTDQEWPIKWGGGGKGFKLTADETEKHEGKVSGRIESDGTGLFGTWTQCMAPDALKGKRVSYTGHLKTQTKTGRAGLWMRVDGPGKKSLAFDNMMDRAVSGETDWKEYEIVLDVPGSATAICFGFLLGGDGIAWADSLNITVLGPAGTGPKPTGQLPKGPAESAQNTDFEQLVGERPKHWGGGGKGYRLTADQNEKHGGDSSGRIEQLEMGGSFGTFTQMIAADNYKNKRVRYTGFLKSKDAGKGGLWMRVDAGRKPVSFDNMLDRAITGTTAWKQYEVILDVPAEATNITFGFLLAGTGILWGDDLMIEIVGPASSEPVTTR